MPEVRPGSERQTWFQASDLVPSVGPGSERRVDLLSRPAFLIRLDFVRCSAGRVPARLEFQRARKGPDLPGIPTEDDDDGAEQPEWYRAMVQLYQELDREIEEASARWTGGPDASLCLLRGICCDFRAAGHRLYATGIEVDFALQSREDVTRSDGDEILCPFWVGGRCNARVERPIGCRTYFCDERWRDAGEEIHERYHQRATRIMESAGRTYSYGEFVSSLRERAGRS